MVAKKRLLLEFWWSVRTSISAAAESDKSQLNYPRSYQQSAAPGCCHGQWPTSDVVGTGPTLKLRKRCTTERRARASKQVDMPPADLIVDMGDTVECTWLALGQQIASQAD